MIKPTSLRQHLTAAVPELASAPDKLSVVIQSGSVACGGEPGLSFEYAYTLQLVVLDYAGSADALVLPILVWLRTHQPGVFDGYDRSSRALRIEVDYNNGQTVDLVIELDLTERVIVTPSSKAGATGFYVSHPPEPLREGLLATGERWTFWLKGQADELLADFTFDPLTFEQAPRLPAIDPS